MARNDMHPAHRKTQERGKASGASVLARQTSAGTWLCGYLRVVSPSVLPETLTNASAVSACQLLKRMHSLSAKETQQHTASTLDSCQPPADSPPAAGSFVRLSAAAAFPLPAAAVHMLQIHQHLQAACLITAGAISIC